MSDFTNDVDEKRTHSPPAVSSPPPALPYDGPHTVEETKLTWPQRARWLFSRDAWVGDYDYAALFTPNIPWLTAKRARKVEAPFFAIDARLPFLLAILLGFQHALAMLAGLTSPPLILAGSGGANLSAADQQYVISAALIFCAFGTAVQITRFKIWNTGYYIGTGLISVVGTSFGIVPLATNYLSLRYKRGTCPSDANGVHLPCPEGYGALIGTCAVTALFQILMAFIPPKALRRIFPPIVTGCVLVLGGINLVSAGMNNWAGGSGSCAARPTTGDFVNCPSNSAPHPLPWGSPEFIGLGFSVFISIILIERFGSAFMKNASVILGLIVGIIISAATGYWDRSSIDAAPGITFIWTTTFPLSVDGTLVLPLIATLITIALECIADITASCDVSEVEVEGKVFNTRIQGGVLADGLNSLIGALATVTPTTTFAQNNGVISLTRTASRSAGYCCCFWLFIMGIVGKFGAVFVAMPSPVLGGMTTYLFTSIVVSGIRVLGYITWTRRSRFILTASLALGVASIVVPTWFSYFFTYAGDNQALQGFLDAIELIVSTSYVIATFIAVFLNLILPESEADVANERRKTLLALGVELSELNQSRNNRVDQVQDPEVDSHRPEKGTVEQSVNQV